MVCSILVSSIEARSSKIKLIKAKERSMALKILTIDDDPSVTHLTGLLLKSYGMDVIVANTGADGIQRVRDQSPNLVLLDMMMPEMNGFEVCQVIRSFSDIPILAYSAMYDSEEVAKARAAGINDYLVKPTPIEIIVAHINQLATPGS
jgi:DNA-binding response OmpR family regulator